MPEPKNLPRSGRNAKARFSRRSGITLWSASLVISSWSLVACGSDSDASGPTAGTSSLGGTSGGTTAARGGSGNDSNGGNRAGAQNGAGRGGRSAAGAGAGGKSSGGTDSANGGASAGDAAGGDAAAGDAAGGDAAGGAPSDCWELEPITRVRLYPAPNAAALLRGGKIMGSNESPTAGFVDLATVTTAPQEAAWVELRITNTTPFRYVKYYGPTGSYGAIAELEFYAGSARLSGGEFGSVGSRNGSGTTFDRALDGDTATYYEGPLANDQYVGLDLARDHIAATPTFSVAGRAYPEPQTVGLSTTTRGAAILYTTNGSDPREAGSVYSAPIRVAVSTVLRAVSRADCLLDSAIAQASYTIGDSGGNTTQSSIHLGNSLTDTIEGRLDVVASSGGVTLDLHKYTIPGAGTQALWEMPSGGLGESNVANSLRTTRFDHVTLQPYPNSPCFPAGTGSDADYVNRFYALAKQGNPDVLLWIYQQWPKPAGTEWRDCITTGASWTPVAWEPPSQPTNWETATANGLWYQEQVREAVMDLNPGGRPIYVIPGGLALVNLKRAVEAGDVPGIATGAFLSKFYLDNGNDDHLTEAGRWFISVVFYACLFQRNPQGLSAAGSGLTNDQAAALAEIAWTTVSSYQYSGVDR